MRRQIIAIATAIKPVKTVKIYGHINAMSCNCIFTRAENMRENHLFDQKYYTIYIWNWWLVQSILQSVYRIHCVDVCRKWVNTLEMLIFGSTFPSLFIPSLTLSLSLTRIQIPTNIYKLYTYKFYPSIENVIPLW